MKRNRDTCFLKARRIVVKVGSNVLTADSGLHLRAIRSVSRQIGQLLDQGIEVILVSSGAMASGIKKMGMSKRPDEIPKRQAIAAIGQAGLILEYEKAFARCKKKVAQILLTGEDLSNRKRYLNARNTLYTLLFWRVIPIINENDTVMVDEIQFGDNDNLAAMITLLMDADVLINLTDIDGLYTKDPRVHVDAELISVVSTIGKNTEKMAGEIPGALGTGGMLSKIKAAKKVTAAGIPMIIAGGLEENILLHLFNGSDKGTFFVPKKEKLASRKCWLAYTTKPQGLIQIDDGAAVAILKRGTSLLPSGIVHVEKEFSVGAPIDIQSRNGTKLGVGLTNYSASDIRRIMGKKTRQILGILGTKPYDEVIHRDNMAIVEEG